LYQAIEQKKYVWVKKSAGLGISTFMLYYIAYKSMTFDLWKGKQVVVITGPNIDVAITLIQRLKRLFPPNLLPQTKETVCELAGVHIQAFPSYNLDSARGLEKPICVWLDEADYFPPSEQDEARTISERYIGKSPGMSIIMTSTPNAPENLYEQIEKLPQDQCLYHRMVMTYEVGLGKIYTPEEISKARESPSFPREYEGQYIGSEGNVFSHESILATTVVTSELQKEFAPTNSPLMHKDFYKVMGVDGGWGSSKFGLCVVQMVPANKVLNRSPILQVVYAEEHERPDYNEIVNKILTLKEHFVIDKIYVDGANPEVVRPIKAGLNPPDRTDYEKQIANLKQRHLKWLDLSKFMTVIPISFREHGREMLGWTKQCLDNRWVAIHPDHHHKLLIALRTAVATDSLLSKSEMSHSDIFDAFRLCLWHFHKQS